MDLDTKISAKLTIHDWIIDSSDLNPSKNDPDHRWSNVFEKYFLDRLQTRYFHAIEAIDKEGKTFGKGFSIVTIQCSLIEFLQSTYDGLTYRHRKKKTDPKINPSFEYGESGPMFKKFLSTKHPFATLFVTKIGINKTLADEFYDCVRNGLLHEARTKGNWVIRPGAKDGNDPLVVITPSGDKVLLWRNFYQALSDTYINRYKIELLADDLLQRNFKQKLDNLFFR